VGEENGWKTALEKYNGVRGLKFLAAKVFSFTMLRGTRGGRKGEGEGKKGGAGRGDVQWEKDGSGPCAMRLKPRKALRT